MPRYTDPLPDCRTAALWYASIGWAVFPLRPRSKEPATPNGFKDATTDPEQVRRWWNTRPTANVGIATGAVSGLVVVDVDPRHNGDRSLLTVEAVIGDLPATMTAITGGDGVHLYYGHPGGQIRSRNNALGPALPGVDIKGDGGYVVAPPSRHPDPPEGTGLPYLWTWPTTTWPAPPPLVRLPGALHALLRAQEQPARATGTGGRAVEVASVEGYAGAALAGECAAVEAAAPGMQSDRLNKAAFNLGQLVAAGTLDEHVVRDSLLAAGRAMRAAREPWTDSALLRTIDSGLRGGMARPRIRTGAVA